MSILPSSTFVPPATRDGKHLKVKLAGAGTETFTAVTGWESYNIDPNALTVIRPDGTRKAYATGRLGNGRDGVSVTRRPPGRGMNAPCPYHAAAWAAEVGVIADQLLLTSTQVREQGDVRQVLLGVDGVGEAPSLADELWAIQFNLRALLAADDTEAKP